MKITDDELLAIIEEVTSTLGQILVTHRELTEGLLDQTQTRMEKEKIDFLKNRVEAEQVKLAKIRHAQQRKRELEKIRTDQDKDAGEKSKQNEGKHGSKTIQLLDGSGKLIGWIQPIGKNQNNILNARGQLVAREVDGKTYSRDGRFMGRGYQGLRVLGMKQRK